MSLTRSKSSSLGSVLTRSFRVSMRLSSALTFAVLGFKSFFFAILFSLSVFKDVKMLFDYNYIAPGNKEGKGGFWFE
jgi:hypothetical protein